jgi:hypothetical protein
MPKRADLTAAQRRAVEARTALEERLTVIMLRELRVFLRGVERDATMALASPVVLAGGVPNPFTLGSVLGRWGVTSAKVVAELATEVASLTPQYLESARWRLLHSELPEKVYTSTKAVLSSAVEAGWSRTETTTRLTDALSMTTGSAEQTGASVVESTGRNWQAIAEMHARTEATAAFNDSSISDIAASGLPFQEWTAQIDNRTRPGHADADGQIVPVGEPFLVDGESLMYPGDPAGSWENTASCRCVVIGSIDEG